MLVLASQSPRRREILAAAGIAFTVRATGVEERRLPDEPPEAYVERLSREKALAAAALPGDFVLAADTVVVAGGEVLEKPSSPSDAARMLRLLAGRRHSVLTGVCLRHDGEAWTAVESTSVTFAPLSEHEIADYLASGEPMDKAGAYAIQGLASRFVTGIEGCYSNVVGLPIARVCALLKAAGYQFSARPEEESGQSCP
jgi:septum formation protein